MGMSTQKTRDICDYLDQNGHHSVAVMIRYLANERQHFLDAFNAACDDGARLAKKCDYLEAEIAALRRHPTGQDLSGRTLEQRLRTKAEQVRHDRPNTLGANLSALLLEAADALRGSETRANPEGSEGQ